MIWNILMSSKACPLDAKQELMQMTKARSSPPVRQQGGSLSTIMDRNMQQAVWTDPSGRRGQWPLGGRVDLRPPLIDPCGQQPVKSCSTQHCQPSGLVGDRSPFYYPLLTIGCRGLYGPIVHIDGHKGRMLNQSHVNRGPICCPSIRIGPRCLNQCWIPNTLSPPIFVTL